MIAGSLNISVLVNRLERTRDTLAQACEELDLDYESVAAMDFGLNMCTHCGIWSKRLILDLDDNPICSVCRDIAGL